MGKLQHFERNVAGRDFVVGDLHGCFDEFNKLLDHVKFNKSVDRVFSVGDLVDRGPKNVECAEQLKEEWFKAVKGNHEELMYESVLNDSWTHRDTWYGNGGDWSRDVSAEKLLELSKLMVDLPLVITVGSGEDRFNVVHGELFYEGEIEHQGQLKYQRIPLTDSMIDNWVWPRHLEGMMTWGRTIISGTKAVAYKWHDAEKMSLTFCGHTPLRQVVQYGRQVYIDLGGVFYHYHNSSSHENAIVLAEPNAKKFYRHGMVTGHISEHDLDIIEKWAI